MAFGMVQRKLLRPLHGAKISPKKAITCAPMHGYRAQTGDMTGQPPLFVGTGQRKEDSVVMDLCAVT